MKGIQTVYALEVSGEIAILSLLSILVVSPLHPIPILICCMVLFPALIGLGALCYLYNHPREDFVLYGKIGLECSFVAPLLVFFGYIFSVGVFLFLGWGVATGVIIYFCGAAVSESLWTAGGEF